MISKIIGLVLIAPFLAFFLNLKLYESNKQDGYKMTNKEMNISYVGFLLVVLSVEAFCVGLYLLVK